MPVIGEISVSPSDVDVDFVWRMEDFFSLPEEDRTVYTSPDFSFDGERWFLMIYPNGLSNHGTSGHVDLYLVKRSSDSTIKQSFSLSLKTVKRIKDPEKHYTRVFEKDRIYHQFLRFIPKSELSRRQSELVPDGVLTVVCSMKNTTFEIAYNTKSASSQCCHCKGNFDAESLCIHQKRCLHRPVRCPDCSEAVMLQKFLDEHVCEKEKRSKAGKLLEQNSKNTCVEACTQTEKENAENSENICVEASTQTEEEDAGKSLDQNCETTCLEACTQTVEEIDELFKEMSRNICVDAFTQTVEQNEREKELSIAELKKADLSVVAVPNETTVSNQTGATEIKKPVSLIRVLEERDLVTDVNDLLKEGRGVDVTFELEPPTGKIEVFAHQLILALRSPYFADLFYGEGSNKRHQVIPLKGINTKAFEQMIRYCYDYKPCLKTIQDVCALFEVAFEFNVKSLQILCYTFARYTKIEPGNVFSILKISEEMRDKSLQDMCDKFLQEKTRDVMTAYELIDVTPAMVHTLLNLSKLSLNSEYELIKWLFDWAKVKFKDSSSKNAREYLEKFLKDMNFLALRFEEFAMLCKNNQEFFTSDEIGDISMNIAFPGTRDMPDWYGKDLKCRVHTGSKKKD